MRKVRERCTYRVLVYTRLDWWRRGCTLKLVYPDEYNINFSIGRPAMILHCNNHENYCVLANRSWCWCFCFIFLRVRLIIHNCLTLPAVWWRKMEKLNKEKQKKSKNYARLNIIMSPTIVAIIAVQQNKYVSIYVKQWCEYSW